MLTRACRSSQKKLLCGKGDAGADIAAQLLTFGVISGTVDALADLEALKVADDALIDDMVRKVTPLPRESDEVLHGRMAQCAVRNAARARREAALEAQIDEELAPLKGVVPLVRPAGWEARAALRAPMGCVVDRVLAARSAALAAAE